MTHDEVFDMLRGMAEAFGYDVHEVSFADGDLPEGLGKGTRGFFQRDWPNLLGWIWIRPGLAPEERAGVLGHEVGHMVLFLLGEEPYSRRTHEPTADLFGKCLVAMLQGDYENPFFRVNGLVDLLKAFLGLLNDKSDGMREFLYSY